MADKFEHAKNGTVCSENKYVVKVDENRYVILSNQYNVSVNTTYSLRNKTDNKPILDFLGEYIGDYFLDSEMNKRK